jgi:mannose-6-phosphate isomerase-like protein (cupin superfamily)
LRKVSPPDDPAPLSPTHNYSSFDYLPFLPENSTELGNLLEKEAKMKKLCVLCFLLFPFSVAAPQNSVPTGYEHWTPAALRDLSKILGAKAATDAHRSATTTFSDYPNEYFMLAHREADGVVEWHETQADIFVVESGTATLIVGGTHLNGETTTPHEKRGGTIEGGVRQILSTGDIVRIPARIPHQLLVDKGQVFSYFVVKIKGY